MLSSLPTKVSGGFRYLPVVGSERRSAAAVVQCTQPFLYGSACASQGSIFIAVIEEHLSRCQPCYAPWSVAADIFPPSAKITSRRTRRRKGIKNVLEPNLLLSGETGRVAQAKEELQITFFFPLAS